MRLAAELSARAVKRRCKSTKRPTPLEYAMMDSRSMSLQELKPPQRRRFAQTTGPRASAFARPFANFGARIRQLVMRRTELLRISGVSIRRKIYSQISS